MYCRCARCGARKTLTRRPENYIRPPRCPRASCDNRTRRMGEQPRWVIDKYRMQRERRTGGKNSIKPCRDWRCDYTFPHRKRSRGCFHHPQFHEGEDPHAEVASGIDPPF